MGIKYIRNTDDASIVCRVPSDKNKVFVFKPRKVDKRNNVLLSNGFTEIDAEDLELLQKESSVFQYYENLGKLTLADTLPPEAMSPEQLISVLRDEIRQLKAELAKLKESGETAALKVKDDEIAQLILTMERQQDTIDALQEQIAEMEIPAMDLNKKDED